MTTYKVITPLRHNRKRYKPDDTVELDADSATRLLSLGVVAPIGNEELPPDENNEEIILAIFDHFMMLSSESPIEVKPNVADVRTALGNTAITVEQRDEAWLRYEQHMFGGLN